MIVEAVFFNGETARDRDVSVERVGSDLVFSGPDVPVTRWSIAGLHPIDPPVQGQPFRITHASRPGARLVLRDEAFIHPLLAENSALRGGYGWRHIGHVLGWTVGGLAGFAAIGYIALSVLPQQVAYLLPKSWSSRAGDQMISGLINGAKRCATPAGNEAIAAMVGALAEGRPDMPAISVEVYDIPILNAFAVPGGRIVITRELLNAADNADEVTGVLAHEIGHVALKHPEAQMVRLAGLQVLLSTISGGGSSDVLGNLAGLAAVLRYSREAEGAADTYARDTMVQASVDPMGLKHFFEKIQKIEANSKTGGDAAKKAPSALDKIGNVFSTHPGTEDRIHEIMPLPAGKTPVSIMSDAQWKALKAICG